MLNHRRFSESLLEVAEPWMFSENPGDPNIEETVRESRKELLSKAESPINLTKEVCCE